MTAPPRMQDTSHFANMNIRMYCQIRTGYVNRMRNGIAWTCLVREPSPYTPAQYPRFMPYSAPTMNRRLTAIARYFANAVLALPFGNVRI